MSTMERLGFVKIRADRWERGDVAVMQFYPGTRGWRVHKTGHGWMRDRRHSVRSFSNEITAAEAAVKEWPI
jgi:hypothetical protein